MKTLYIPQILSYTKVKKKKMHQCRSTPDVKIPKGGISYEERARREEAVRLKSEKDWIAYLMADRKQSRPTRTPRQPAKAPKVKMEWVVGCVRAGFTFYKTLTWYK